MRTSHRTLFLAGSVTTVALVAAACVSNSNSPPAGSDLDAGFFDGGGTPPGDGSPNGTDATKPGPDGSPSGTDGAVSGGDAGTLLDGSADGGVVFGAQLAPPLSGVVSDDGSAMIISAVGGAIMFSHFEPGQGWTAPAAVPGVAGSWTLTSDPPRLGVDGSGNVFLVWASEQEDASFNWIPVVARYDHATNTWGAPVLPNPTYTGKTTGFYAVGVSPSGTAIIETVHSGGTSPVVYALRYAAGTWTPELALTDTASIGDAPVGVQVLDNGRAIVFWTASGGGPGVASRDTTGVWTGGEGSISFVDDSTDKLAATDNAGDVLVPYSYQGLGTYFYDAADAGWSGPKTLTPLSSGAVSTAMNATTGDAIVTHIYPADAGPALESFAYTSASATWQAAQQVPVAVAVGLNSVVYDSAGNGLAVWGSYTPGAGGSNPQTQIFASTYTIAGGWTAASPALSTTFGSTNQSLVAMMSPSGQHAFAAWTENGAGYAVQLK